MHARLRLWPACVPNRSVHPLDVPCPSQVRHAEHRAALERISAWEPQMRRAEEEARSWRSGIDEAIRLAEQRGVAAAASAQVRAGPHAEIARSTGLASSRRCAHPHTTRTPFPRPACRSRATPRPRADHP